MARGADGCSGRRTFDKIYRLSVPIHFETAIDKIESVQPLSLTAGTRLGPYEVLARSVGRDGRSVCHAKDTKLGRDASASLLLLLGTRLGSRRNDILHP